MAKGNGSPVSKSETSMPISCPKEQSGSIRNMKIIFFIEFQLVPDGPGDGKCGSLKPNLFPPDRMLFIISLFLSSQPAITIADDELNLNVAQRLFILLTYKNLIIKAYTYDRFKKPASRYKVFFILTSKKRPTDPKPLNTRN